MEKLVDLLRDSSRLATLHSEFCDLFLTLDVECAIQNTAIDDGCNGI